MTIAEMIKARSGVIADLPDRDLRAAEIERFVNEALEVAVTFTLQQVIKGKVPGLALPSVLPGQHGPSTLH